MEEVGFSSGLDFTASEFGVLALNLAAASLLVGLVAVAIGGMLRRASMPLRYALACAGLLVMLASPVTVWLAWQWNLGIVPILVLEPCDDGESYTSVIPDFEIPAEPTKSGGYARMDMILDRSALAAENSAYRDDPTAIDNPASHTVDLGLHLFNSLSNRSWIAVILSSAVKLFLLIWGIVGIWLAGRLANGLLVVRRLRRSLRDSADPRLLEAARHVSAGAGMSAPMRIAESPSAPAPLTLGWWRTVIVIPAGLPDLLTDEQLASIVAHELGHVRRRDAAIGLIQQAVAAVFWWNPFLRVINRQISRLRERLCDDFATIQQGTGVPLAEALVRVAEWSVTRTASVALTNGLLESGSDLEERVRRLTQAHRPVSIRMNLGSAGLLAAFGLLQGAVMLLPILKAGPGDVRTEFTLVNSDTMAAQQDEVRPADNRVVGERERRLAAPAPINVSGQVLTKNKRPVAGAKVSLLSFYGDNECQAANEPLRVTQTDEKGRYQFLNVMLPTIHHTDQGDAPYARFGTFQVCAEAEGFGIAWHGCRNYYPVPRSSDVDVDEEGVEAQTDFDFYLGEPIVMDLLARPARTLSGRVHDELGRAVSGAEIQLCHLDDFDPNGDRSALRFRLNSHDFSLLQLAPARFHQARTGADGRFKIDGLPEGTVAYLTIEHSEFAVQSLYVAISDEPVAEIQQVSHREPHAPTVRTNPVEVRFRRTRQIFVDVVHDLDQTPAPGVTVSARPAAGESEAMSSGEADEQGRAELKLPPGKYKIFLLPVDASDDLLSIHDVTLEEHQDGQVVRLPIRKGCTLTIEAFDADTGAGIPGVSFMEITAEGRIERSTLTTDVRGECQAIVTPGARWYGVQIAEGYSNLNPFSAKGKKEILCEAGKSGRLQFRLKK